MACGLMISTKMSNLEKKSILFLITFLSSYYCSIDLKRQSEHFGFCPDTSFKVSWICSVEVGRRPATK